MASSKARLVEVHPLSCPVASFETDRPVGLELQFERQGSLNTVIRGRRNDFRIEDRDEEIAMLDTSLRTTERAETESARRAVYEVPENIFQTKRPPVPAHVFVNERDKAFSESTPSGPINLDLSEQLGFDYPATTPLLLARYLRVCAGENLSTELISGGEIHYVIQGNGESNNGNDQIAWRTGDVFCFPGGARTVHHANEHDAVLLQFTDEPLYSFTQAQPPAEGAAAVEAVHHLEEQIDEELDKLYRRGAGEASSGMAVQLMSRSTQQLGTCLPSVALAMNSLAGGTSQRPHVHNAVALTLCHYCPVKSRIESAG